MLENILSDENFNFTTKLIYENDAKIKDRKKINLIHFNDVYNIESGKTDPVGGASRFLTVVEKLRKLGPNIVLFSGDALSPSHRKSYNICVINQLFTALVLFFSNFLVSKFLQGKQMVEFLNLCNIASACIGNHEFGKNDKNILILKENLAIPILTINSFYYQHRFNII